jgi:hypothetical protein
MKKILSFITPMLITFVLGWVLSYHFREPKTVIVYQDKIITNTITKNVNDMSCEEAKSDLYCFYTGFPTLEIDNIGEDEYIQTASLCERKWQRQTTIKSVSKQFKNMVIASTFFDSEMRIGAKAEYYRFFGRFGVGGGLSITQGYGSINGGVAWQW